jgi:hypothetical protein
VYDVGELLSFKENDSAIIIGKLVKIIPQGGNEVNTEWPMIEVQW